MNQPPATDPLRPARHVRTKDLSRAFDRLLPAWFLLWDALGLGILQAGSFTAMPGIDFRIYRAAGVALLAGADPWQAAVAFGGSKHFAAAPTAAQLFEPFALLPFEVGLALWTVGSVALVLVALRRLGLPAWWLLFPPVVHGLVAGNPQVVVFALLVVTVTEPHGAGSDRTPFGAMLARAGGALAVGLKVYAIVPLIASRAWRAAALAIVLTLASVAVAPDLWTAYLREFGEISTRIVAEARGGTSAAIFLSPEYGPGGIAGLGLYLAAVGLMVAVALRDVSAAGWIVVPLLWPAAEYHYATFAMPVARRLSTFVIAMSVPNAALVGMVILALEVLLRRPSIAAGPPAVPLREWLETRQGVAVS